MKRFFTMLFALSLLLSLAACGSKQETLPKVIASEPAMETVSETKEAPEGTYESQESAC